MLSTMNRVATAARAKPHIEGGSKLYRNDGKPNAIPGNEPYSNVGIYHTHFVTIRDCVEPDGVRRRHLWPPTHS